ncbi:MAG: RDD family protein, partial [Opitutaceae bacterium]|nr:RDD family protein [Opitutaceae bacterium]
TYLLHATISEMIWGRSLGKRIFGLRVVLMDGRRAGVVAILLRNLLRLAELPIAPVVVIMMLYSPLRQRAGDIAAATIVISDAPRNDQSSEKTDE